MSKDNSQEKLSFLNGILGSTEKFTKICETSDFSVRYPFKEDEWIHGFQDITTDLNDQIVLLFIGPYSSGKSTFVNALIGKDILPTNDTPCTAVITEIQFKKGGDHSATIYRKDGETEPCEFSHVIDIINGPTGAVGDTASYHHIVLELDTEMLADKSYEQFVGKVKIVDCPGYGSQFYTNEEVIADYMQKSNFTFWMSPCNKFGGSVAKQYLSEIKRKTQTLIPVITKSDLIPDEQERDKIRESLSQNSATCSKSKTLSSYRRTSGRRAANCRTRLTKTVKNYQRRKSRNTTTKLTICSTNQVCTMYYTI